MRIVFHETFHADDYSPDPFDNAAETGRLVGVIKALREEGGYAVDRPSPALREDLLRGHSAAYVDSIAAQPRRYELAALAAGASLLSGELAMSGEPAFACVRPPGHHASRASAWGHCTFSNVALAVLRLRDLQWINSAFVVDIDLHTGDGTLDVLRQWPAAEVFNGYGTTPAEYLQALEDRLKSAPQVDVLAVSAGFDTYKHDLGRNLDTSDYFEIGRLLKDYANRNSHGRRFAVLEGGYYIPDLGKNVLSFCRGFD